MSATSRCKRPHWEQGHRCHGYWLGKKRVGFIGLPHRNAKTYGYDYTFDLPHDNAITGHAKKLQTAKLAIERAYAAFAPEPAPSEPKARKPWRKTGRRCDARWHRTSAYIPRELHTAAKIALLRIDSTMTLSDLLHELLVDWVAKQPKCPPIDALETAAPTSPKPATIPCPDDMDWVRYTLHQLDKEHRLLVDSHLAYCPSCRNRYTGTRRGIERFLAMHPQDQPERR